MKFIFEMAFSKMYFFSQIFTMSDTGPQQYVYDEFGPKYSDLPMEVSIFSVPDSRSRDLIDFFIL